MYQQPAVPGVLQAGMYDLYGTGSLSAPGGATGSGPVAAPSSPLVQGTGTMDGINGVMTTKPAYTFANGATATSAADAQASADEVAYWNDQLALADQQLARLGTQRQNGTTNIDNSYNSAFEALTGQKGKAERDYTTRRDTTIQDNQAAKSDINRGVRGRNSSLQRLLGGAGSGSSSAASVLAPFSAALVGNQQRQQVQTAYGRNIGALDTGWNDTLDNFKTGFADLDNQRQTRRNELESGLATTEANLLEQKQNAAMQKEQAGGASYAQARAARQPYQSRINDLIGTIDSLGVNPNITPGAVNVARPDLAAYTYDRYAAPTAGSGVNPGMAGKVGNFWTLLNQDNKDKERQV